MAPRDMIMRWVNGGEEEEERVDVVGMDMRSLLLSCLPSSQITRFVKMNI